MNEFDSRLINAISTGLKEAEENSDVVITTINVDDVSKVIADEVKKEYAGNILTPEEIYGIAALISHATADKKFFDWEMPILCSYTAEEFGEITKKLRNLINL